MSDYSTMAISSYLQSSLLDLPQVDCMVDQEGISVAISSLTARADGNELAKRVRGQQHSKEVLPPKRMGLYRP